MNRCSPFLSLLFSLAFPAGRLISQQAVVGGQWEEVWRNTGVPPVGVLGGGLIAGRDLDGDGVPDLVATARGSSLNGFGSGAILALSGADGSELWRFPGLQANDALGHAVAWVEDLDGDGADEVLASSPTAPYDPYHAALGEVLLISGRTGQLLRMHTGNAQNPLGESFGGSICGLSDQDDDGVAEYAVGAPWATNALGQYGAGRVVVYSGRTGAVLAEYTGTYWYQDCGSALTQSGVRDLSGHLALLIGATGISVNYSGSGAVLMWSPSTGQVLHTIGGPFPHAILGKVLTGTGDLDSDGVLDFASGSDNANAGGYTENGSVTAFSGATGVVLWTVSGNSTQEYLGRKLGASRDMDGDGVAEVLITVPTQGPMGAGVVQVRSGVDGRLLWELTGGGQYANFGTAVAGAGDVDGDDRPDLVIGVCELPSCAGTVIAYAFDPFLRPSRLALSAALGGRVFYDLDFPASEAGRYYALLASGAGRGPTTLGGLQVPLTLDPLLQRMLDGHVPPPLRGSQGLLDAGGDAQAALIVGPGSLSGLIGRTLYAAAVSHSGHTGQLSSAPIPLRIEP